MKKSKHSIVMEIIIYSLIIINLLIMIGCTFHMRHNIIRKINEKTETPVTELNLSADEKISDFKYFYDCIATSLPIETLNGIKEQYNIDFIERYDTYTELISATENDLEFFAAMRAIIEDIPTFHTDIVFPDYDYYQTLGCWNIDKVLDTKDINSKSVYWNTLLKNESTLFFEKSPEIYKYV